MKSRRGIFSAVLILTLGAVLILRAPEPETASEARPNVLLILVDDMGYYEQLLA